MKFSGQPEHDKVDVSIKYRDVFQDAELVDVFVKTVTLLARAVGVARVQHATGDSEAERWAKEFLIGYGLLAVGEARSILLLFSDGLNLHARIHFRAIFEYEHKTSILLADQSRVLAFRDSLAFELRAFAKRLGKTPAEIEAEIARVLGVDDPSSVVGTKESAALGGDVKSQMKNDLQPEKRYLGTFAWTSQVNHGSVLALYEVAKATDGKQQDVLLHAAATDNKSNDLLYDSLWVIFKFIVLIEHEFSFRIPGVDELVQQALKLNERLKFSTPEHEAEVQRLREEKRRREEAGRTSPAQFDATMDRLATSILSHPPSAECSLRLTSARRATTMSARRSTPC